MSAIEFSLSFDKAVNVFSRLRFPAPKFSAVLMISFQLLASALIVFNPLRLGVVGAIMLIFFTFLTIPMGHAFWREKEGKRRNDEWHVVLEHISLIGGLLFAAVLSLS
ncbi:hypothetical protein IPC1599_24150 [Pseudomonas aeruginosa]|nr:hypothetical protein C2M06_22960 [Pseudomonas aeruginosa]TEB80291.1 hypothetical protein IPC1604_07645 [Pseudomonas aeruginosa]TEC19893.1 hypothetical protein IPC1599_24150 [Pseudomonas aeruginosa]HBO5760344.1 hypothetical protein [Pseudomonas aeruginosa]HBO5802397.1 hypothetical protein [Pseudomonas aeruginosa]